MKLYSYPPQGSYLGQRCAVCFDYDTANAVEGVIVRDDIESPYQTIIRLDDGRYVRSVECQYRPLPPPGGDAREAHAHLAGANPEATPAPEGHGCAGGVGSPQT